jgi:tRNA/tmRNA/rRNA uracil-C5-methylase (TrmA/RlmC/RlmD family)
MPETHFDEWTATRYAALWPELFDPAVVDPAVDFLAGPAAGGSALEFGIGTGRIAIPLSRRDVAVHGIELSPAMIAQLDLMARLAGLTLRERWSDWNRAPFTGESGMHVSVWEKPSHE